MTTRRRPGPRAETAAQRYRRVEALARVLHEEVYHKSWNDRRGGLDLQPLRRKFCLRLADVAVRWLEAGGKT
jgi:hypothetical protein